LILTTDHAGNILRVSPSCEPIAGYSPKELVGRNGAEFVYSDDLEAARAEIRIARRGQQRRNFETRWVHRDGRLVPLAWSCVWSDSEQCHFLIGRDMTESKKAEDSILADGVADKPQLSEATKLIAAAARRGAELTRRLLAFARKQPLEPRETDINALIINAQKLFRPSLGEHLEIEVCLDENAWPALVDPTQLTTALLNLAVNARDAMPKGGKLTLETRNVVLDETYSRAYTELVPATM